MTIMISTLTRKRIGRDAETWLCTTRNYKRPFYAYPTLFRSTIWLWGTLIAINNWRIITLFNSRTSAIGGHYFFSLLTPLLSTRGYFFGFIRKLNCIVMCIRRSLLC